MDAKSLHENERSEMNLMDEEINDPDIEARLYAEIYYSNDTYPDINLEQEHQNDSQTADPKIPDNSLWCVDPQPGRSDTQYRQSFNVHDKSPQSAQYIKKTGFFPKRYRALIDGPIENQNNLRNRNRYDDWSPRNNSVRINRMDRINQHRGERQMKPPERRKKAPRSRLVIEEDDEPDRTSLTALDESLTIPAVQIPSRLEPIEPTPSSAPLASERIDENPEPPEVIDDNSKYKVVAKKLDENKRDPVDAAESDSDASIFEVPVPPKPAPPLISLKDSDEESSSSDEESPIVIDNDSSEQLKTSKKFSSSSSETSIIVDDSDDSNDSTVNVDTDNLIINCTSVQKGVGSIDEIRKIRGNDSNHTIIRQSDEESMTESEAMNWKSLEGKITRDKEVINPCEPQIEFWNELSDDSESRSNLLGNELLEKQSNNVNPIPSEKKTVNENEGIDKSTDETSPGNNKRIRGDGRDEIVEIDEPAPKKKKQKEPNREISFQEYLFQPMPKQMVAFYNNPRGGEMMRDIKEIQNKMPRNPNCWAILDDDMHPPGRRTRIVCALCQNEGHVRSKCPNRSKPPICHICGLTGHMEPRCPYNKQCINCGKKYGTCRKTCEMCNTLRCSQCSGKGHTMASCPDNWRKYHQTTSGTEPKIPKNSESILKPSNQLSCCNCTRKGHDAASCINYRWSAHFIQKCHIKDYNQGPSYRTASTVQECQQNLNSVREVIDISHLGIDVNGPSSYLFHFVNWKPTNAKEWKEYSLVPNKLGIDYPPPGATPIYPKFLKIQFNNRKCCPMEVIVRRSFQHNGLPEIIVKTPDSDSLERLKIIILQWLIRCKADKDAQTKTEQLPQHRPQLLNYFEGKKNTFIKKQITKIRPDELNTCKLLEKSLISKNVYNKKKTELTNEEKKNIRRVKKLKTKFVIATYKIMLVGTLMDTFSCFMDFMKQLKKLKGSDVPGILYMTAVWYNFELFVPHISPAVVDAIKRWHESPIVRERGLELFQSKYLKKKDKVRKNRHLAVTDVDPSTIPSLLSLDLSNAAALIGQDKQVEIEELSENNDKKINDNENNQAGELPENVQSDSGCIGNSGISDLTSGIKKNKTNDLLSSIGQNNETELEIKEIIPVTSNDQILTYNIVVGKILDNNCSVIDNQIRTIQSPNVSDNNVDHLIPSSSKPQTPSSIKNKKGNDLTLFEKMCRMKSKEKETAEINKERRERGTVETNKERRERKIAEKNLNSLGEIKIRDLTSDLRSKLTKIIKEDSRLSIPIGMPVPRDPRVYNEIILRNKTNETMKFIERHNIVKPRKKMEEYMNKSSDGVVSKQHLIDIWTMIRAAMKKRMKIRMNGKSWNQKKDNI